METDLTSPSYWGDRQHELHLPADKGALKDLLDAVVPFLRAYKDRRWLELGCSPGHVSCLLYRRIPFVPSGVDSSPEAHLYKETMSRWAGVEATLFHSDFRTMPEVEAYDVVMSFGLAEHFTNPDEVLEHHVRLCSPGGLVVVTIPHLRRLQWMYHLLFDRKDLARHNLPMMDLETFRSFSEKKGLDVLLLRHVGRLNFWNVDDSGLRLAVMVRKGLSLGVRALANGVLSHLLPAGRKFYAPWIVFVARKR